MAAHSRGQEVLDYSWPYCITGSQVALRDKVSRSYFWLPFVRETLSIRITTKHRAAARYALGVSCRRKK